MEGVVSETGSTGKLGSGWNWLAAKLKQNDSGNEEVPLWRRILDKLSGIWLVIDAAGALLVIAAALYVGFVHGIWTLGAGLIIYELIGMANSFYAGHRQLRRT